jgi:hypothetical protein
MGETKTMSRKPFDYGAGAIIVLVISVGIAAVVYGLDLLSLGFLVPSAFTHLLTLPLQGKTQLILRFGGQ